MEGGKPKPEIPTQPKAPEIADPKDVRKALARANLLIYYASASGPGIAPRFVPLASAAFEVSE